MEVAVGSYDEISVLEEIVELRGEVMYSRVGYGTWKDRIKYSLVLNSCRNTVAVLGEAMGSRNAVREATRSPNFATQKGRGGSQPT